MTVHVELLPLGPAYLYVPLKLPAHAGLARPTAAPAKTTDIGRPVSNSAFVQVEVVPPASVSSRWSTATRISPRPITPLSEQKCSSRMKAVGQSWCAAMATRTCADGKTRDGAEKALLAKHPETIPPHIREDVKAHLAQFVSDNPDALLFAPARGGCHLNDRVFNKDMFKKAAKDVGRDDLSAHDLRRFAGTKNAQVATLTIEHGAVGSSNDQNLWMAPRPGDVKERTFPGMI